MSNRVQIIIKITNEMPPIIITLSNYYIKLDIM